MGRGGSFRQDDWEIRGAPRLHRRVDRDQASQFGDTFIVCAFKGECDRRTAECFDCEES